MNSETQSNLGTDSPPGSLAEHKTNSVTIVLPIFNERANIRSLFERIDSSLRSDSIGYRVVAVDDGSTDGTSEILESLQRKYKISLIRHGVNQGLGIAIRTGLQEALRQAARSDIIFTMDADESHTPASIRRMLSTIDAGYDVVIASRFQPGSQTVGVPFHRRALSNCASIVFRLMFPTKGVRDFTCGYRAYRASALMDAIERYGDDLFEFDGFQCMVDLLLKLRGINARFAETPVVLRYDLKQGQSKMRIMRTIVRTMALAGRRRLGL